MKKAILSATLVAIIGFTSCKNEVKKEVEKIEIEVSNEYSNKEGIKEITFGVRGNCSMCKRTIENAANSLDGVTNAIWDVNKKKIDVSFDASKTNKVAIYKVIANAGYDTEEVSGTESAYINLPRCCKYNPEMPMNQSDQKKTEDHSGHNH